MTESKTDWRAKYREIFNENKRLEKVRLIAEDVVWFDWSGNDADAVHAMEQLRIALAALTPPERANNSEQEAQ